MCGFLVHKGHGDNTRIRLRGPDATNAVSVGGLRFVHNLLAITGAPTLQPFVDRGVVCVYNGQIYNQPYSRSDGDAIIPLYRKEGTLFARQLDGEFAIALYDFEQSIAVFATDPFKTKPLFLNGVECASYRSGVGGQSAAPNEILVTDLAGKILDRSAVRNWDLSQWNESYDAWIQAFEAAVAKRAKPRCFIGLSSGYDSGALLCALSRLGVPFKAFSYLSDEHLAILDLRMNMCRSEPFVPDPSLLPWLHRCIDNEPYTIVADDAQGPCHVLEDGATLGLATFARLAATERRRVCLSGQGADEVMSDYSPWPSQSELKGVFPEDLRLWRNFNYSCQESYLIKEEYTAGAFGIENRYPYLDAELVQEFLWLTPQAKNRHYKAPLREYLLRMHFPFEEGVKRGFFVQ